VRKIKYFLAALSLPKPNERREEEGKFKAEKYQFVGSECHRDEMGGCRGVIFIRTHIF
jgi:hypothetical protein